jgi:hypothetical protein
VPKFTWRSEAHLVICQALGEGRHLGLVGKDLVKHVSDAYPFGERANTPYKIWLQEFNVLVKGHPRKTMAGKRTGPKLVDTPWPGLTVRQCEALGLPFPDTSEAQHGSPSRRLEDDPASAHTSTD